MFRFCTRESGDSSNGWGGIRTPMDMVKNVGSDLIGPKQVGSGERLDIS